MQAALCRGPFLEVSKVDMRSVDVRVTTQFRAHFDRPGALTAGFCWVRDRVYGIGFRLAGGCCCLLREQMPCFKVSESSWPRN